MVLAMCPGRRRCLVTVWDIQRSHHCPERHLPGRARILQAFLSREIQTENLPTVPPKDQVFMKKSNAWHCAWRTPYIHIFKCMALIFRCSKSNKNVRPHKNPIRGTHSFPCPGNSLGVIIYVPLNVWFGNLCKLPGKALNG